MAMPRKPDELKNVQISITMPPDVLAELDNRLGPGQSRSRAITVVVKQWLKRTKSKWIKGGGK